MLSVKTFPGADCNTDCELFSMNMRLKVIKQRNEPQSIHFDFGTVDNEYPLKARNRFATLVRDLQEEEPHVLSTSAGKHLWKGNRKRQHWISDKTLEKIEERGKLKGKSDLINKHKYKQLNKEIRSLCRTDKTNYIISKCNNIREQQLNGNL